MGRTSSRNRRAPQPQARQDRRRDHDARTGGGQKPGPRAPARLRQRHPRLRHRQGLRHRARLQEVVRTSPRGPQADLPGHQGHAPNPPPDARDGRPAAGDPGDRLHRPLLHPRAGRRPKLDEAINFVKSQEFKETADAIRKSGKAKFIGFSTHHQDRAQIIQAAAEAGIVDAIMLQYTPWLDKDSPLNKALDACRKKGIGLISMKQIAGHFGDSPRGTSSTTWSGACRRSPRRT